MPKWFSTSKSSAERLLHGLHCFALPSFNKRSRLGGLRAGGIEVFREGQHGFRKASAILVFVEVEQPIAEADVAPHEALRGLLGPAADNGRDAVADAQDWRVHLVAEQTGAANVGRKRLAGEPVVGTPDGARLHVGGERVVKQLLADGHLRLIFGADEHFEIRLPEQALQWLRDKLPNLIDRSTAHRRHTNDPIFELVREGIVNALVHRDYSIEGAKCQLIVTPDTIEIRSPGKPVEPITLEQMQSFDAPMLSRNPILHFVFAQMDLAEERGLGLKSMQRRAEHAHLPLPKFVWKAPYLVLTVYRTPESVTNTLNPEVLAGLSADERAGWEFIAGKEAVTNLELMDQLGFDRKKSQRILKKLIQVSLIRRVGKGPAPQYTVGRS